MTEIDDQKARLRKAAYARRKTAFQTRANTAPEEVADIIDGLTELHNASVLAGYCPIRTELDPFPAMERAVRRGLRVCVPEIVGAGQALAFRAWWPGIALQDGPFGASVPVGTDRVVPDAVLVPLVAFDDRATRLGYGGGFYDRTLAALRSAGSAVPAIGIAYAAQRAERLPRGPYDVPLDAIVTEDGILRPGGS